jgi:CheY-like chemotaxis protein
MRPFISRFREHPIALKDCERSVTTLAHILLVEGDPNDVELTLTALSNHNLTNEVVVTREGRQALDYLYRRSEFAKRSTDNPAVIRLGLKLPKIDGLEILTQIKSDERLKMVPVVVLTSFHEEKDVMRSYSHGGERLRRKARRFSRVC